MKRKNSANTDWHDIVCMRRKRSQEYRERNVKTEKEMKEIKGTYYKGPGKKGAGE